MNSLGSILIAVVAVVILGFLGYGYMRFAFKFFQALYIEAFVEKFAPPEIQEQQRKAAEELYEHAVAAWGIPGYSARSL